MGQELYETLSIMDLEWIGSKIVGAADLTPCYEVGIGHETAQCRYHSFYSDNVYFECL